MDNHTQVPPPSTAEAENFWTDGFDARQPAAGADLQPETSTTSNADGIDMPGVGNVRPGVSPDCAGRESVAGDGSPNPAGDADLILRAEDDETPAERRDRLSSCLITAAHALAMAQIEPADEGEPAFCTECVHEAKQHPYAEAIAHEDNCLTGRVLKVVALMCSTLEVPSTKGATDGETLAAGDVENRPRESGLTAELLAAVLVTELLAALYTMIGLFGMPDAGTEAALEIRAALKNGEALKLGVRP